MRSHRVTTRVSMLLLAAALLLGGAREARAHCDTMSGPVVTAARRALDSGNVNLVLIWVQPGDDAAIRDEFARARADRAAGGAATEAADRRFFEALVRIHRTGEGAPYTGIKPAGTDVGPAVTAADQSLATGSADPIRTVLTGAVLSGVEKHLHTVLERRNYDPDDVPAGRAFVQAYVEYTHFAEGLYDRAAGTAGAADHGSEAHGTSHDAHGAAEPAGEHSEHADHTSHLPWILAAVFGLALIVETGLILRLKGKI